MGVYCIETCLLIILLLCLSMFYYILLNFSSLYCYLSCIATVICTFRMHLFCGTHMAIQLIWRRFVLHVFVSKSYQINLTVLYFHVYAVVKAFIVCFSWYRRCFLSHRSWQLTLGYLLTWRVLMFLWKKQGKRLGMLATRFYFFLLKYKI